jgi:Na+/H+-dicarboxylate symporter
VWLAVIAIGTGALAGLAFGEKCRDPEFASRYRTRLIKVHFVVAAASLCVLAVVSTLSQERVDSLGRTGVYLLLMFTFVAAGISSLGFAGPALDKCALMSSPVAESISGGSVQLLGTICAAVIPILNPASFLPCTVCAVVIAIAYLLTAADDVTCAEDELELGLGSSYRAL